ncbi:MAG: hypothetical protein A2513_04665 [Sulfurimonas sp. RIFOXYD12_FULL_33_39]|uniref:CiaD-like domain-containing protein n=1 Tax=unclassified Sulfurimonas TaxID=2623549 RepID=UPI0008D3A8E9|nr:MULTISPECIES: hypothetical protein [unclassified Sulfurimonas]OHE06955.1 MAG: hypothetical protein A3G74_05970 [Sulfurimonas sp. RIFCSPLOWO2_12_FULL_34_6]OHE09419.1 MAG: hypothetical protein A2513_04665 [Sulfurimonas sp. RIFOXYD12_FULL_33_39]OHE12799.1 MAG: hypothetical protein A2530_04140 [Sulfurimonas sp. RIFOXYD2_FULL_34_21]
MELKDVILSTLAEMEDIKPNIINNSKIIDNFKPKIREELSIEVKSEVKSAPEDEPAISNEMLFLISMRERLLVLFEGFQAPNNTNIEAKVDMTLNFLEYVLVTIDSRVEELERGSQK